MSQTAPKVQGPNPVGRLEGLKIGRFSTFKPFNFQTFQPGLNWSAAILGANAWLIYIALYAPILVLIVFSFNQSKLNAIWTGFTFDWYGVLFGDEAVGKAAVNTLIVAVASTAISTVIGTMTALALSRYSFFGKTALEGLLYIPIIIPEIVMGVSLLLFFVQVKLPLSIWTIIMAHITFNIPFVAVVVRARLAGFDDRLLEAAADLGAGPWRTFRKVTLPLIMPGIVGGALLAFTLSIDDFVISFFTTGPGANTLPLHIYSMVKTGVTPEINAVSTLLLLASIGLVVLSLKVQRNN
jgi:spermidine/putrescine transport system permease protein